MIQEEKKEADEGVVKTEKKPKKRHKKILMDLRNQIEFYFSEPNLQKDRFIRQKLEEHSEGCIEIATIASFNRMMQLCEDIELVIKAMKMCPSVEVIDDKWVRPAMPLTAVPKNVDALTVYVERLPPTADHDWIKALFSSCGNVVYVSLPRYKSTRVIKGFAFVEFETEREAKKALQMFNKKCKQEDGEEEDEGKDQKSVEMTEKKTRKQKLNESANKEEESKGGDDEKESNEMIEKQEKKRKKQKQKFDETENKEEGSKRGNDEKVKESDDAIEKQERKTKKQKQKLGDTENKEEGSKGEDDEKVKESDDVMEKQEIKTKKRKQKLSESDDEEGKGKRKKSKHKNGEETTDSVVSTSEDALELKDKSGKLKKRKRSLEKEDGDESGVKVRKNDEVKNEETKTGEITNELSDSEGSVSAKRKNEGGEDGEISASKKVKVGEDLESAEVEDGTEKKHKKRKRKKKGKEEEEQEEEIPALRVISKLEWLRLKQEYQQLQREAMKETKMNLKIPEDLAKEPSENVVKPKPPPNKIAKTETIDKPKAKTGLPAKLEMVSGVVLKYSTKENIDKQNLRDMFSRIATVSYLEKEDDQDKGYVRFATKERCKLVVDAVANGSLEAVMIEELTDKEDMEYWEKLNVERTERWKQKKPKKRGTQKIVDKIEAKAKKRDHVHFDE